MSSRSFLWVVHMYHSMCAEGTRAFMRVHVAVHYSLYAIQHHAGPPLAGPDCAAGAGARRKDQTVRMPHSGRMRRILVTSWPRRPHSHAAYHPTPRIRSPHSAPAFRIPAPAFRILPPRIPHSGFCPRIPHAAPAFCSQPSHSAACPRILHPAPQICMLPSNDPSQAAGRIRRPHSPLPTHAIRSEPRSRRPHSAAAFRIPDIWASKGGA